MATIKYPDEMSHTTPAEKPYRHRAIGDHVLHPETQMMGYGYDPKLSEGSVKCPIFMTSTFAFRTAEDGKAFFEQVHGLREKGPEGGGLIYSRINNPDIEILEDRLTLWDRAEASAVFASGMGAIASMLLTFLRPGDALVHSEPMYGGTEALLEQFLPQFGIHRIGFMAGGGHPTLEEAVAEGKTKGPIRMIFIETPANPTNGLVDIRACADIAKSIEPDARGDLPCRRLGLSVGIRPGSYEGVETRWLRFIDADGSPLETTEEAAARAGARADDEKRRADDEKRRADEAERRLAELARLRPGP